MGTLWQHRGHTVAASLFLRLKLNPFQDGPFIGVDTLSRAGVGTYLPPAHSGASFSGELAIAFFRPLNSSCPPASSAAVSDHGEARQAARTLSAILRVFGDNAVDDTPAGARELARSCARWADRVATWAPPLRGALRGADVSASLPRHGEVLAFFAAARQAETARVITVRAAFEHCVRFFSRLILDAMRQAGKRDEALMVQLELLRQALQRGAHERVLDSAQRLAAAASEYLQPTESSSSRALELLQARLLDLDQQGVLLGGAGPLDPTTGLCLPDDLRRHLEFISGLRGAVARKPTLYLVELQAAAAAGSVEGEAVALEMAEGLLRVFISADHYLARVDTFRVAAVSLDLGTSSVERLLLAAHQAVTDLRGGAVRAVASPNRSKSAADEWWGQLTRELEACPWGERHVV